MTICADCATEYEPEAIGDRGRCWTCECATVRAENVGRLDTTSRGAFTGPRAKKTWRRRPDSEP